MKFVFFAIGIIALIALGIIALVAEYTFDSECGNYLKLAGDAPTVEKADEFLGYAIGYIERERLTTGNSGVIFRSYPTNDLAIWYGQIKGAKQTTESIIDRTKSDSASVSQLERDNALMKIREVVLDQDEKGTSVTHPDWIIFYPSQVLYWFVFWIALIAVGICVIAFIVGYN
ncbi:MAG: hypothetical protein ACOYUK_02265 [Patescibacteria group bacterium]